MAAQLGTALDPLQPEFKADGAGALASVVYDGIHWKLSYTTSSDPNWWSLSYGADPDVSKAYDVIAVVKQATGWAVFRIYLVSSAAELPAPASLPLVLIGLAGLGWRIRSRRKQCA